MKALDIDFLTRLPPEFTNEDLNEGFQRLLEKLTTSLNSEFGPQLNSIFTEVRINLTDSLKPQKSDFINFGVTESRDNGIVNITMWNIFCRDIYYSSNSHIKVNILF